MEKIEKHFFFIFFKFRSKPFPHAQEPTHHTTPDRKAIVQTTDHFAEKKIKILLKTTKIRN